MGRSKENSTSKPIRRHKILWIILAAAVLALVMAASLGYLFRMSIFRMLAPEQYTELAMAKMISNARDRSSGILDWTKYDGKAVSHSLSYDTGKVSADSVLQFDPKNEKALLEYSFKTYGLSFADNQVYISPEQIAVSLPAITFSSDYLTIDPDTFASDWKAKGWDKVYEMPDPENLVHALFGKSTDSKNSRSIQESAAALLQGARFTADGQMSATIGTKQIRLDVMTYIFPQKEVNDFLKDYPYILNNSSFQVKEDVAVHLSIDPDGFVRKISTEKFAVSDKGTNRSVRITIELSGDTYPTDTIKAVMSVDTDGVLYEITVDKVSSYKDSIYSASLKMTGSGGTQSADSRASVDVKWDKKDTIGANLTISSTGKVSFWDVPDMTVTGKLTDTAKGTTLSKASIELQDTTGVQTKIDFDYSAAVIKSPKISVDTTDSTPLLDYLPFELYMEFSGVF